LGLEAAMDEIEELLRTRRKDDAMVAALSAEAQWSPGTAARLVAHAHAALRARVCAVHSVALRVRALGDRIEAFFGRVGEGQLVQAAQARGDAPGGVLVRHAFGAGEASTHVDLAGERFVVMIDLGADAPARRTRVALVRDGRELASENLRKGRWLLPTLSAGAYHLRATDESGAAADLDLVLERAGEPGGPT